MGGRGDDEQAVTRDLCEAAVSGCCVHSDAVLFDLSVTVSGATVLSTAAVRARACRPTFVSNS